MLILSRQTPFGATSLAIFRSEWSLSNRQELQGVGVASYRFEDEIWAAVNRADINGASAGYSACVDLEDVSSPTLQTGPLRIGVTYLRVSRGDLRAEPYLPATSRHQWILPGS